MRSTRLLRYARVGDFKALMLICGQNRLYRGMEENPVKRQQTKRRSAEIVRIISIWSIFFPHDVHFGKKPHRHAFQVHNQCIVSMVTGNDRAIDQSTYDSF